VGAYTGSNKPISVEAHSIREEQLLEALSLIERRLHPQVRGTRQHALCEGQDALYVELFEFAGVLVDLQQRELLAQLVFVTVIRVDVDRLSKQKRFVQSVELLLNRLRLSFSVGNVATELSFALLPRT
jgi:hypothetical protein